MSDTISPGLIYPSFDYADEIANKGYFIYVDRNASEIGFIYGMDIDYWLRINPQLIFVVAVSIAGIEEDIITSLSNAGYTDEDIKGFWSNIITRDNIELADENLNYYRSLIPFPGISYPVKISYDTEYIELHRQIIHDIVTQDYLSDNPNFTTLPPILDVLVELYDQYFFQGELGKLLEGKSFTIQYSSQMTKTGGVCARKKTEDACHYTIKIGGPVVLGTFNNSESHHLAGGLKCLDRLYCLQLILEHELIHLLILLTPHRIPNNPVYEHHGKFFRELIHSYFRHTEINHLLIGSISEIKTKEDFKLGQLIRFEHKGKEIIGTIDKLNPKTAKVGIYTVPYSFLSLVEPTSPVKATPSESRTKSVPVPKPKSSSNSFQIGQTVSFTFKGREIVGVITRLNPKTAGIGVYNIGYEYLSLTDKPPTIASKSRDDFRQNQKVSFEFKNKIVEGFIIKLNPTKAVVRNTEGTYDIPYSFLTSL